LERDRHDHTSESDGSTGLNNSSRYKSLMAADWKRSCSKFRINAPLHATAKAASNLRQQGARLLNGLTGRRRGLGDLALQHDDSLVPRNSDGTSCAQRVPFSV
jgi:hypothetical protein